MTATADDLARARRLVESPHWRWMPGMRAVEYAEDGTVIADATVLHVDEHGHALMAWPDEEGCVQQEWDAEPGAPAWLPDLFDPATEGCLLRLAREAWSTLEVFARPVAVNVQASRPRKKRTPWATTTTYDRWGWSHAPSLGVALAIAIPAGEVRDA